MADHRIYTRAYSGSSARQLVSGKGLQGDQLSNATLLEEFQYHDKWDLEPTALVSASDRIVDTLKRAFDKYYEDDESAEIWIAFIEIPPTINETATRIHSAKELAEKCGLPEPNVYSHEVVFEWAIPENYVVHKVSLQTLMKRELRTECFSRLSTVEIRQFMAREFQRQGPWEVGLSLGIFARKFGARAPLDWISRQLFHDCVQAKVVDDDVVRLTYAHGQTEMVDFQFFGDLDDGIDTSLYDWWLSEIDFHLDYKEFEQWRDIKEDSMNWDLIEFWETLHDVDCDGTIRELSAKEKLSYNKEKNKLLAEHEKQRTNIEAEAVRLGL